MRLRRVVVNVLAAELRRYVDDLILRRLTYRSTDSSTRPYAELLIERTRLSESHRGDPARGRLVAYSCVAFALAFVFGGSKLVGQDIHPGFGLGVGVPAGDYRKTRGSGPLAQLFVVFGGADRRLRLRIEAEGVWFPGRVPANTLSSTSGDMRILSGIATLMIGPRANGARPYFLVGGGPQWVSVPKVTNPYGYVSGARAGIGVEGRVRDWTVRAEIAGHAVLSDFATGHDFGLGTYWPLTVAIQF
jgi:hypothetical protein